MRGKDLKEFGSLANSIMKHALKEYSFEIKSVIGPGKIVKAQVLKSNDLQIQEER